ncbi:MAG: CotH kinase family protein, partial [Bacteroidales bacterium]|nr:CotH kinase family protein [Bacteroidales bacterium]
MIRSLLFAIFSLLFAPCLLAQANFPENGPLYIDTVVPRIDITINPDTLDWIYAHVDSDIEFHARFIFDNGTIRDTIDPVGFRLRGNTSRYSKKKSFKVSFNTFTDGGKYYGVEKLNLNGEHNDPTIMRSKVMWDILRAWDIPAPRSNHVQVYINGDYYGLYINVEHVDEEFVLNRFGNNDGNLYKCLYPADLAYLGTDPDSYKILSGDTRVYELKTNEETDDYTDLATFIDVLNHSPNEDLVCRMDALFNTYDYLKIIAADIFCGNWDGYIFNKNNFYLYNNSANGKMEYIPYDVDNSFGIDWFNVDWTTRNIYTWQMDGNEQRPLYTRMMNYPELRNQFSHYVKRLINNVIDMDSLIASIEIRKNMIAPYVVNDPYYPLDYGYTYADFLRSYTEATGAHVKQGLYPYLIARKTSMNAQVENFDMMPVIKYISHKREIGQQIWIKAKVDVEIGPVQVFVDYSLNDGAFQQAEMIDTGGGVYTLTLENISTATRVSYQIRVMDGLDQEQILPCDPAIINPSSGNTPLLFINEFMADNASTLSDEFGNYGDWIEVYNGDTEAVYLGDLYLTDNLDVPNKWQMPDMDLPVGGYELFWADGTPESGDHHTNFKLGKDGEAIGIFN